MSSQDEAIQRMEEGRRTLLEEIKEIELVLEETVMPEFIQQILTDAVQHRLEKIESLNRVLD